MQKSDSHNQKGSITVEASLSMVLFTFIMIALLSIINICRVQATLASAMDLTALEISQYSYLYQVLGARSAMDGMNEAGQPAGDNIHGVIKGADELLYGVETMFTLLENPTQAPQVANDAKRYIERGAAGIQGELDKIIEDPKQFVLSLGALAISKGVDVIEKELVKAMCVSHIGNGQYSTNKKVDANKLLRSLGVVNGVDGLDFQFSNLFDGEGREDINIVVTYRAKLFSPFDWLQKDFVQSASTRAWLSGDEQYVYAEEPPKPEIPSGGELEPETTEPETQEPQTETETSQTEETESESETETETESESINLWEQNNLSRGQVAKEVLRRTYEGAEMVPGNNRNRIMGYDVNNNTFYGVNTIDTFSPTYNSGGVFNPSKISSQFNTLDQRIKDVMAMDTIVTESGSYPIDPSKPRVVSNVWVIPDNASPEVKAAFQQKADEKVKELNEKYKDSVPKIIVSINIVTGFGDSPNGSK